MKNLIICGFVSVLMLTACKKEAKITPYMPPKTTDVVYPADSASFSLDGKTYILGGAHSLTTGNTKADRKVDSFVNYTNYHVSESSDTTFYYETHEFNAPGMDLDVSFFKKYATKDMVHGLIYYPSQITNLFQPGSYQYGTDFNRENATNGVGLAVNHSWQTYSDQAIVVPVLIGPASESNAHFQILSFKKIAEDDLAIQYVLQAKFDATLFDKDGNSKQLTDGYARINVAIAK